MRAKSSYSKTRNVLRRKPKTERAAAQQSFLRQARARGLPVIVRSLDDMTLFGLPVRVRFRKDGQRRRWLDNGRRIVALMDGEKVLAVVPPGTRVRQAKHTVWPSADVLASLAARRLQADLTAKMNRLRASQQASGGRRRTAPIKKPCFFCRELVLMNSLAQWRHLSIHMDQCGEAVKGKMSIRALRQRLSVIWSRARVDVDSAQIRSGGL